MRKSCFIVALSTIEKQSREQAFKQSVDDMKSWYICDLLSLPKISSMLVVRCRCV